MLSSGCQVNSRASKDDDPICPTRWENQSTRRKSSKGPPVSEVFLLSHMHQPQLTSATQLILAAHALQKKNSCKRYYKTCTPQNLTKITPLFIKTRDCASTTFRVTQSRVHSCIAFRGGAEGNASSQRALTAACLKISRPEMILFNGVVIQTYEVRTPEAFLTCMIQIRKIPLFIKQSFLCSHDCLQILGFHPDMGS